MMGLFGKSFIFASGFVLGCISTGLYLAVSDMRLTNDLSTRLYHCGVQKQEAINLAMDVSSQLEVFQQYYLLASEHPDVLEKMINKKPKPNGMAMGVGGSP